jgi:predicted alpha/beta superfamily hydrolase
MTEITLSDGSSVLFCHTLESRWIGTRRVDVWRPPGYRQHSGLRYPVLYMHDGQNLFDPALASSGVDWGIDEAVMRMMREQGWPGAIVVGIWNSAQRWREYAPQQPFAAVRGTAAWEPYLARAEGPPCSDAYLGFLVEELKPLIDTSYRTLPDQPNTFVMGSSMGGLISLYALTEHPGVFGAAGCLSTHWPAGGVALVDAMGDALPSPGQHRLYFDFGTATLDTDYEPYQRRMDEHLRAAGYTHGQDWLTLKFEGAEHHEHAWRERVPIPLAFLLTAGHSSRSEEIIA